jgi:hypothetical protein
MLSNPLFTPFSYDSFYDPYRAERRYYGQRLREQEARRQAEQEYRLKLLQRQRQQQEAERQYKLELIRRMQAAEEERRQAKEIECTQQKLGTERARQRPNLDKTVETTEEEEDGVSTHPSVASTTSNDSESESVTSDQDTPEKSHQQTVNESKPFKGGQHQLQRKTILSRKSFVVVEDASDSEDEDDAIKSVWRNRRPSPGNWMEPVEFSIAI